MSEQVFIGPSDKSGIKCNLPVILIAIAILALFYVMEITSTSLREPFSASNYEWLKPATMIQEAVVISIKPTPFPRALVSLNPEKTIFDDRTSFYGYARTVFLTSTQAQTLKQGDIINIGRITSRECEDFSAYIIISSVTEPVIP